MIRFGASTTDQAVRDVEWADACFFWFAVLYHYFSNGLDVGYEVTYTVTATGENTVTAVSYRDARGAVATVADPVCTLTYQPDNAPLRTVVYDSNTGAVVVTP